MLQSYKVSTDLDLCQIALSPSRPPITNSVFKQQLCWAIIWTKSQLRWFKAFIKCNQGCWGPKGSTSPFSNTSCHITKHGKFIANQPCLGYQHHPTLLDSPQAGQHSYHPKNAVGPRFIHNSIGSSCCGDPFHQLISLATGSFHCQHYCQRHIASLPTHCERYNPVY